MKTCSRCHVEKPVGDFYVRSGKPQAACKRCTCDAAKVWREANPDKFRSAIRNAVLIRKYGINAEEYEALVTEQGGACAICGEAPEGNLNVDHDHETGAVRGLLCRPCNTGIGLLREDVEILAKATKYLNTRST